MGTVGSAPLSSSSTYSSLPKKKWRKLSGGRLFCSTDRWEASKSVELLLYPNLPIGREIPTSLSMLSNDHRHHLHHYHQNGQQQHHMERSPSLEESESLSGRSSGSFILNPDYNQIISTITSHDPDCALHGNNRRSFKMKTSTFLSNDQPPVQRPASPHTAGSSSFAHTRTPSDPLPAPIYAQIKRGGSGFWRNRSIDVVQSPAKTTITPITSPHHHQHHYNGNGNAGAGGSGTMSDSNYNSLKKPLVPSKFKPDGSIIPKLSPNYVSSNGTLTSSSSSVSSRQNATVYASLQRPRVPPPPPPPHRIRTTPLRDSPVVTNGHSRESLEESLPSLGSDDLDYSHHRSAIPVPVPPPRKYYTQQKDQTPGRIRICQALYDCVADRDDELSFEEGEVMIILRDKTDDEDWMEGFIEVDVKRRGLIPASYVRFLNDNFIHQ